MRLQGCDLTNVTICPALEAAQPAAVLIYNQQAQVSERSGGHGRHCSHARGTLMTAAAMPRRLQLSLGSSWCCCWW